MVVDCSLIPKDANIIEDVCSSYDQVIATIIHVQQQVDVQTYVRNNTAITIDKSLTINVDNAPTRLSTIVTVTHTKTVQNRPTK